MSDDLKRVTAEVGKLYQQVRQAEAEATTDDRRIFCAGMVQAVSAVLEIIANEGTPS